MELNASGRRLALLLTQVEHIAQQAGALIMQIYGSDFAVRGKADASPVTEADEGAERLITSALQSLGAWPVVAEEAASRGETPAVQSVFWLVDPLDGTREFVARNGEFTVNIALIEDGSPVLGVVLAPALHQMFSGIPGQGAWLTEGGLRRRIQCRLQPAAGATVATSRWHGDGAALDALMQARAVAGRVQMGSSLKFGLLASAQADLYPRLGRTMEWDTAAGHAVLLAAGGQVNDLGGQALRYGKAGFENPDFIARGAL